MDRHAPAFITHHGGDDLITAIQVVTPRPADRHGASEALLPVVQGD
jgi:hypothetical protein